MGWIWDCTDIRTNGQLWPYPLLMKLVYECPYGYYKKGPTQFYVSSGIGILGTSLSGGNRLGIGRIAYPLQSPKQTGEEEKHDAHSRGADNGHRKLPEWAS